MAMKLRRKIIAATLCASLMAAPLAGCQAQMRSEPDFSGISDIAELASLECYYHNVVKYHKDAEGFIVNLFGVGRKNLWFEYDGSVKLGFDVGKISISEPDASGNVTVTIPPIEVLGHPDVDPESITDGIEDNGIFTRLSGDDRSEALAEAQKSLVETVNQDEKVKLQAKERGKSLLEQYVKNVGEGIGQTYTVTWNELPAEPAEQ